MDGQLGRAGSVPVTQFNVKCATDDLQYVPYYLPLLSDATVSIMKHAARCLRGAGTGKVRKRGVAEDPRPHDI